MAAIPEERVLLDSDETLAERVGAGDTDAFEEIYRRYARPLAMFGARLLRDRTAGEDVAQTSLMNAYRSMRRGTRPLHLRPWLYRIARNAAYEAQRRRHGEIVDSALLETAGPEHESEFDRELWYDGLRELPPRQRDAYLLRELNGLSVAEIGERLGLTREQVDQALFAARNKLAERLAFGGRIDCESLQTAARAGALPMIGRRALKAHVRTCPSCRSTLPAQPLGLFGNAGFALRQLVQWLTSGGAAPVVAKVGAVVATVAVTAVASPHVYRAVAAATRSTTHSAPAVAFADTAAAPAPSVGGEPAMLAALARPPGAPLPPFLQTSIGVPAALPVSTTPTDTTTTDPTQTDTTQTDPTQTDTTATDPAGADPPATDPTATDTAPTDTTASDPTATDTTPTDTTSTDTTATDTTATDTTATDTTPTDTTATDTTPTDTTAGP